MKTKVVQHVPRINIKQFTYDSMTTKVGVAVTETVIVTDTDTFGSQLLSKTSGIFYLVTVIPPALICRNN